MSTAENEDWLPIEIFLAQPVGTPVDLNSQDQKRQESILVAGLRTMADRIRRLDENPHIPHRSPIVTAPVHPHFNLSHPTAPSILVRGVMSYPFPREPNGLAQAVR